ncbi:hypothetical protein, partial [Bacteroides gallinaceum]|uniref:hypothetical protein n=1 Tax=Bacteroides gallinaceum TaxID=1462571 RepID=UPI00195E3CB5
MRHVSFSSFHASKIGILGEIHKFVYDEVSKVFTFTAQGRVNQRVQHYEIFLKKTSAGVKKLSFSLGLALIFFL